MYHLPCGWNKQETPCRVRENSEGCGEHCEVPHILLHEKVFGRSQKAGLLHHGRDERTRQDQPTNENLMKKEVCEDPGEHKSVVPTAPEQEEQKELQLCDDEEEHGCSGDRIRRGRPCNQQERRRLDDGTATVSPRRDKNFSNLPWSPMSTPCWVAHHRTGSKKFADPRHFPQTCKRHHYPGRSRESHLGHEVGDKKHECGFEPCHLTGNNPIDRR